MATTSPEHRVACHQYASERKRAGRKPWDLQLTLGPLDEDGAPEEWAKLDSYPTFRAKLRKALGDAS